MSTTYVPNWALNAFDRRKSVESGALPRVPICSESIALLRVTCQNTCPVASYSASKALTWLAFSSGISARFFVWQRHPDNTRGTVQIHGICVRDCRFSILLGWLPAWFVGYEVAKGVSAPQVTDTARTSLAVAYPSDDYHAIASCTRHRLSGRRQITAFASRIFAWPPVSPFLIAMLRRWLAFAACTSIVGPTVASQTPTVVRATNAPTWGTAPALVHELRIGVLDGDEEYMFESVSGVAVGQAGRIYVADGNQKPIIRQYNASGKFERNIGGFGEGPGEYRSLGAIRTFADGRLGVWDNRIQRFTIFSTDGKRITNARIPSGLFSADLLHIDRQGNVYVQSVTRVDSISRTFTHGWIHATSDLRVTDTIAVPESPSTGAFVLSTPAGFDRPFTPDVISTMTARGELLTGSNFQYAFELRRKGVTVVRVERPFVPLAVTAAEHREWTAWAENTASAVRRDPNRTRRPPPVYLVPKTKPAFKDLECDSDGRIWVRRYVEAVSRPGPERAKGDGRPRRVWREPATYDVFEPTGRFLGSLTLPWDAEFKDAVGLKVYLVVTGPDGDESVQRFRIEPSR